MTEARSRKPQDVAVISEAAKALADHAAATSGRDMSRPVSEIRCSSRAACASACNAAIEATGVTLSERVISDVTCMVIDPPEPRSKRQIVYLFGGGFTLGSPFEDLPISASLSAKTGAQVIAPEYPLAPEHPYPAALDACTNVIASILEEAPGACLCGESAGGNLALAAVHRLRAENHPQPKALALLSPAVDMVDSGDSGRANRDPFARSADSEFFRSCFIPDGADLADPGLSPIYGPFDAGFPPVMLTTGTRDIMLSGCVRLDRVLREAGVESTLRVWEGMWHVFEYYPGIPEAEASLTEIAEFLDRQFD